jgi:hypothetical protein
MRCERRSVRLMISFLAVASAGFPGCGQPKSEVANQPKPAASVPAAPNETRVEPIAEKDCQQYADEVVKAVASGNKAAFNSLIDWEAIFATATANLDAPPKVVSGWIQEMRQALSNNVNFVDSLIQNSKAGGQFDFLRIRISHGRQVVMFRLIGPGSRGVNYIEFIVKQGPDHKIRAVDLYPYVAGEFVSESIHRALLPAAASQSRSFLEKLVSKEQDLVLDLPKIPPISQAIVQGRKKDALRMLDELRPGTKKEKMVLLLRTQAAQEADQNVYLATLEEFRSLFPNDPCLDLQLIDYYTLTNKPDEVLKCVDRLDKSVGGDPYLNFMRASLAMERGDRADAKRLCELLVEQEPTFQPAYLLHIALSLKDDKDDETLLWLKKIHETLGTTFTDLTTVQDYARFVKSPQYKEWLKYLEKEAGTRKAAPTQKQNQKQGQQATPVPK